MVDGHSSHVYKIDNEANEVVAHPSADVAGPYGIALNWDETEIWLIGKGEGSHNRSGTATIIIVMAIVRKAYKLEEYVTPQHFINPGYMLGALALIMMHFSAQEYVVVGYKLAGSAEEHFHELFTSGLAPYFWTYVVGGMIPPGLIILFPWTRTIAGILVVSVLVNIGMWFERYMIVVGDTRRPTTSRRGSSGRSWPLDSPRPRSSSSSPSNWCRSSPSGRSPSTTKRKKSSLGRTPAARPTDRKDSAIRLPAQDWRNRGGGD